MKFSDHFNVTRNEEDTWFDPILIVDTNLFIDPFLIYDEEFKEFKGSHKHIIEFFNDVIQLTIKSKGNDKSKYWIMARRLVTLKEAEGLCLGYSTTGIRGSGIGNKLADNIISTIWESILDGLDTIDHLEELSILNEGIGADRISDMTATLLFDRISRYTERICNKHDIPTREINYRSHVYNHKNKRWQKITVNLPINPFTAKPVLLIPEIYLRDLPMINPDDFWNYSYDNENEILRAYFDDDISKNVNKATIRHFAKLRPDILRRYIDHKEDMDGDPYDLRTDPRYVYRWYDDANELIHYIDSYDKPISKKNFQDFVEWLTDQFRHFIEEKSGWRLLWYNNRSRSERSVQLLFYGVIFLICHSSNIVISPETDTGRGPIDFKLSSGVRLQVLIETKLARNTKFWSGLEKQLPTYMNAEQLDFGSFVVICYSKRDLEKVKNIHSTLNLVNKQTNYDIFETVIDATPKKSASKL